MLPQRMYDRFGVCYNVFSIAPRLKTRGCRGQKAACVSAPRDADKRNAWRPTTWPPRLRRATARQALRLCGDAASFPPWGTLTDTGARRGPPPQGKTCGTRPGETVCGLMESCTGRRCSHGQAGRRNSAASMAFLTRVWAHPPHPLLLLQAGAQYHPSAETTAGFPPQAARLQGCPFPTYAPDDTPIETRWKKSTPHDTPLHSFPTFAALTNKVEQALRTCTNTPEAILALCSLPTAFAQAASVSWYAKSFS